MSDDDDDDDDDILLCMLSFFCLLYIGWIGPVCVRHILCSDQSEVYTTVQSYSPLPAL